MFNKLAGFRKAWLAPALATWLTNGIVMFVEKGFTIDIPANLEGYILLAITSGIVWLIPNDKEAPAAPAA